MKEYDVTVIGAGPAGSFAAIIAAEEGYSTCLVEKEKIGLYGRYKSCGGALPWKLIDLIDYPEDKISRIFDTIEMHHVDGEIFKKKTKGAIVWRGIFDKYLSDIAIGRGVKLKDNNALQHIVKKKDRYKIYTNEGTFLTNYIIAADGIYSTSLSILNWPFFKNKDLSLTITQERRSSKSYIDKTQGCNSIHLFFGIKDLIPIGYAYLFPKREVINVGWGCQIDLIKNSRMQFEEFLRLPIVKKALLNSNMEKKCARLLPMGERPLLFKNKVFAIGDAGGFVDPINGEGIIYAMMSGQIAIESLKRCDTKGKLNELESYYLKTIERKFLNKLRLKKEWRNRIFTDDYTLKKFLSLWEKNDSIDIIKKGHL